MKKNKMMRLASLLLVMVLMSTCVIGGTFAKYTTQDSASDTARVAKWGVELAVVGNLYGEDYDDDIVEATDTNLAVASVNADAREDVVAPGTKNAKGMTFSLNGVPEVAGEITATLVYENIYLNVGTYGVMVPVPAGTVTAANFNEFKDLYTSGNGSYTKATAYSGTVYYTLEDVVTLGVPYYPVEYAMTSNANGVTYNTTYGGDLSIDTLAGLAGQIGGQFGSATTGPDVDAGKTTVTYSGKTFAPNTDLTKIILLGDQSITWKWDFCQNTAAHSDSDDTDKGIDGNDACDFCKADTILGLLQGNSSTALNGEVVKVADDFGSAAAPKAAADTAPNDYNLESYFELDITVTQTD